VNSNEDAKRTPKRGKAVKNKTFCFSLSVALLLAVASSGSGDAAAQTLNEVQGPNVIISPYTWWSTNPSAARFLETQVMHIGTNLYLYVGGGPYAPFPSSPPPPNFPGWDCSLGEKIMAFKTPFTFSGLRSTLTMSNYVGTVSPCYTSVPGVHYVLGSVFQSSWDGQYKMLINETENGTAWPDDFKRVLLQTSTDGEHWSLVGTRTVPFIQQSTVNGQLISVSAPSVIQGSPDWWGFFQFGGVPCNCSTGRLRVTQATGNPRGFIVSMLATDGTWQNVNDDGTFSFMPMNVEAGAPWTLEGPPVSFFFDGSQYQVWGAAATGTPPTGGCYNGPGGDASIAYGFTEDSNAAMRSLQGITSSVRAMPTINSAGRLGAARINDAQGKMLVYGASTDRYCTQTGGGSGWKGAEILLTVVQ